MNCPICETPMIVLELDQVEVDHCRKCGGVWLDPEEMDLLLEGSAGRDEIRANLKFGEAGEEKTRRCPICRHKMEKARVRRKAADAGIQIDRCDRGHGTWLDGGELQGIIALSEFPEAHRIHQFLQAVFRDTIAKPRA
ncbi:MAG TPA: zf-TFIIB domain-containing protein [Candidatus Krumholzibacteria bacterium]|nr:zf-TFIIB domain-containing protein [Candidatus Krumholzibacteria bacterium]